LKKRGYRHVNLDSARKIVSWDNMTSLNIDLLPFARLAVVYARRDLRAPLSLLLGFDQRLSEMVQRASEPMIAQMKIAWWHDAMKREPAARPKGEPVFAILQALETPGLDTAMGRLLDAWDILLAADTWDAAVLQSFAEARSAAIFGSYAHWVSSDHDVTAMGQAWAVADLEQRFGARVLQGSEPPCCPIHGERRLRPLSILAMAVRQPPAFRMIWHALTGR
jgi:15-cis-phytoene synthase